MPRKPNRQNSNKNSSSGNSRVVVANMQTDPQYMMTRSVKHLLRALFTAKRRYIIKHSQKFMSLWKVYDFRFNTSKIQIKQISLCMHQIGRN